MATPFFRLWENFTRDWLLFPYTQHRQVGCRNPCFWTQGIDWWCLFDSWTTPKPGGHAHIDNWGLKFTKNSKYFYGQVGYQNSRFWHEKSIGDVYFTLRPAQARCNAHCTPTYWRLTLIVIIHVKSDKFRLQVGEWVSKPIFWLENRLVMLTMHLPSGQFLHWVRGHFWPR